jgi:hypothetical protein
MAGGAATPYFHNDLVESPRLCRVRRRQQSLLKPTQASLQHTHQSLLTLASRGVRLGLTAAEVGGTGPRITFKTTDYKLSI